MHRITKSNDIELPLCSMGDVQVLFVLTDTAHKKMLSPHDHPCEIAPDRLDPTGKDNFRCYAGSTSEYKEIASSVLENISVEYKTDWNVQAKLGVFTSYPEAGVLSVAIESISKPNKFVFGYVHSDLEYFDMAFSGHGEDYPDKPFLGAFRYYTYDMYPQHRSRRLLIISDCLDAVRQSVHGYLIEGVMYPDREILLVTPEQIEEIRQARKVLAAQIRNNVIKVELREMFD